jgi:aromatic ring hydroxylase
MVLPKRAMTKSYANYALTFAVPANAKGVKMISKPEKGAWLP